MSVEIIDKRAVAKSFGKAAAQYDSVAHFQRWVGAELLKKVPPLTPRRDSVTDIVDLGCGTGYFSPIQQKEYPTSEYIGIDLSEDMINFARNAQSGVRTAWLTGDAESIPLKSNSVDLVFSSLSVQWCGDLQAMFSEVNRILSENGVFVFSSLVEGSLIELKSAWSQVDEAQHVNAFASREDYRGAVNTSDWSSHSLEVEPVVLSYQKVRDLTKELKTLGAHNMTSHRSTKLTGKRKIQKFLAAYEQFRLEDGSLPATYQVLWGVLTKKTD